MVTITNTIETRKIHFKDLVAGEFFMKDGMLYMAFNDYDILSGHVRIRAILVSSGDKMFFGYEDEVTPVDVEIKISKYTSDLGGN